MYINLELLSSSSFAFKFNFSKIILWKISGNTPKDRRLARIFLRYLFILLEKCLFSPLNNVFRELDLTHHSLQQCPTNSEGQKGLRPRKCHFPLNLTKAQEFDYNRLRCSLCGLGQLFELPAGSNEHKRSCYYCRAKKKLTWFFVSFFGSNEEETQL